MSIDNVNSYLISFITLLFLSGCFGGPKITPVEPEPRIVIQKEYIEKEQLVLEPLKPLDLEKPKWYMITPNNQKEVWKRLKEEGKDLVIFGVSDESYEILSLDIEKILGYLASLKKQNNKYIEYYKPIEGVNNNNLEKKEK